MKESHYSPCGLYCGACGAQDCGGCLSASVHDWGRKCIFRNCAHEKKVAFCCFCGEYPCKALHEFMHDKWPHHWTMEPNLAYIMDNGVEKWLHAQKQKWSCKNCSSETMWYQRMCSCGQQLEVWDLPE